MAAAKNRWKYQKSIRTTDATVTTLQTIPVVSGGLYRITAQISAARTGGSGGTAGDSAGYMLVASCKNVSGTASVIGQSLLHEAEDQAAWTVDVSASGGTILVRVTGAASNNVLWSGYVEVVKTL